MDVEKSKKILDHHYYHHKFRSRSAGNLASSSAVIKQLCCKDSVDTLSVAAANPLCPRRLQRQFFSHSNVICGFGAGQKISAPRPTSEKLAQGNNLRARGEALDNLAVLNRNKLLAEGGDRVAIRCECRIA